MFEWAKSCLCCGRITASSAALAVVAALGVESSAAPLWDVPVKVRQPDGTAVRLLASGDEHFNWLHDAAGHVVMQDPSTGLYVYAEDHAGTAVPTPAVAGVDDPEKSGIPVWGRPPAGSLDGWRFSGPKAAGTVPPVHPVPNGTINSLTVFIRFSDEPEFSRPLSSYSAMFNADAAGSRSLLAYYREVSYGKLSISATFYPSPAGGAVVSYKDSNPRDYYRPYNSATNPSGYTDKNRWQRELGLVSAAVNAVKNDVPTGLVIDKDGTGEVDSIVFVVSGGPDGWADLLWPHATTMGGSGMLINGKEITRYTFQLDDTVDVGVLAHEMFHNLGSPDLYHYARDGIAPAWVWDIMEYDVNTPHMTTYMKWRYGGWLDPIPDITQDGEYTLNPTLMPSGNVYRIRSPYSAKEHFIVEYRKREGAFEGFLPASGLLAVRINTARDGQGNSGGPPDEVYVMRPNGRPDENGAPWSAAFAVENGMTTATDSTNPRLYLSDGTPSGLMIYDVGAAGGTITFKVRTCNEPVRECGADACGNWFGACPAMTACGPDGKCAACIPDCAGKECGTDGCGGSCGACAGPLACSASFKCVESCTAGGGLQEWAAWPSGGYCPSRQSRTWIAGSTTGDLRWSIRNGYPVTTSPTMDRNGTLYFGSSDGKFHAIGPDGREKWSVQTGGSDLFSEMTVASSGDLVAGGGDGKLYVVSAEGETRWTLDAGSPIDAAPVIGGDGSIYFCTRDGRLFKASPPDAASGAFLWSHAGGGACKGAPAIGPDGTVYYTNGEGRSLFAVSPEGSLKWVYRTVFKLDRGPSVLPDGSVAVGDMDGTLHIVRPDGAAKWNFWLSTGELGGISVTHEGSLLIGSSDGNLYSVSLDPAPHVLWTYAAGNTIAAAPVVDANGNIFTGDIQTDSDSAYVHALKPDGTPLWKFAAGGDAAGQVLLGLRGHVYAACDDGYIYVLGAKCTPQCLGKECGSDNCGKTCGECPPAGDACMASVCNVDFKCAVEPSPAGTACDDGDPCTVNDQCDGAGKCVPGGAGPSCSDGGTDGDKGRGGAGCSCSTAGI